MFTNKVNAKSFGAGKEKEVVLMKRVKLTQEFEEMLEVVFFLNVPSGPENLELIKGNETFPLQSIIYT